MNEVRVNGGFKVCLRAGDFIKDVFKKEEKKLTAEECLKLHDWYGIRAEDVVKMAISHEFEIDKNGFVKLLDINDEMKKKIVPL